MDMANPIQGARRTPGIQFLVKESRKRGTGGKREEKDGRGEKQVNGMRKLNQFHAKDAFPPKRQPAQETRGRWQKTLSVNKNCHTTEVSLRYHISTHRDPCQSSFGLIKKSLSLFFCSFFSSFALVLVSSMVCHKTKVSRRVIVKESDKVRSDRGCLRFHFLNQRRRRRSVSRESFSEAS